MSTTSPSLSANVLLVSELNDNSLADVIGRFGMQVMIVDAQQNIPGSFWGDAEAGLIENRLYVRRDTPVHSALHEACHYICMDAGRRQQLDTDAGGGYDEENAVCYLQILLSDYITGMGRARMWADMDSWGYSFRLGSAQRWFTQDAEDARQWLLRYNLITSQDKPRWQLRD